MDNCATDAQMPLRIFKANTYQFTLNPTTNELTVKIKPKQSQDITYSCPVATDTPKPSMLLKPLMMALSFVMP